jgi:hypothetical protein
MSTKIRPGMRAAASAQRSEPVRAAGLVRTVAAPARSAAATTSSLSVATYTWAKQRARRAC